MIKLVKSLQAWNSRTFAETLQAEVQQLSAAELPLHLCSGQGGMVDHDSISASILASSATEQALEIRLAVFFTERIGGCSCHDDPAVQNAYGELLVCIDRLTADTSISLWQD